MTDKKSKSSIGTLREAAREASDLLRALSNSGRLLLLCELAQGERNVSELQERTDIRQPSLSQQLGVLREEQLVETRRDGKNIYYRISSPQALAVMRVLHQEFCAKEAR